MIQNFHRWVKNPITKQLSKYYALNRENTVVGAKQAGSLPVFTAVHTHASILTHLHTYIHTYILSCCQLAKTHNGRAWRRLPLKRKTLGSRWESEKIEESMSMVKCVSEKEQEWGHRRTGSCRQRLSLTFNICALVNAVWWKFDISQNVSEPTVQSPKSRCGSSPPSHLVCRVNPLYKTNQKVNKLCTG